MSSANEPLREEGAAQRSLRALLRMPLALAGLIVTLAYVFGALFAPVIAPQNPFDPASLSLLDSSLPPAWVDGGDPRFLLGTDDQGRDIVSTLLYGSRISLLVGFAAIAFSLLVGVGLGLVAGFVGGPFETVIMRLADVQLTIPGLLIALLIDGIARAALPGSTRDDFALYVVIFAIGISDWPQFARLARAGAIAEGAKDYVAAARLIGVSRLTLLVRHILPNIAGPILVVATIGLALAIIAEATLAFLGVGVPPTTPSLGTMIRNGANFLYSAEWWMVLFPALALIGLVLAINVLGDALRDALDPKGR